MASGQWRSVVLVGGTSVQNVFVAQELYVTNLEDHVQRQTYASVFEDLSSAELLGRERRNGASVTESSERLDVVRVPLGVDTTIGLGLEVEDRRADPILLTDRLLALAVKVPDGLGEQLGHVGVLLLQGIPDGMT